VSVTHFQILEREENGWVHLDLSGELDLASAPELGDRLSQLAAERMAVRLDLSNLEFMDSTGLQSLVKAINDAESSGWRLHIDQRMSPQVARLLQLVQFERLIPGYDSDRR
jgi:stage II sporulation protein AA (anti-sigma F factor antagonist)